MGRPRMESNSGATVVTSSTRPTARSVPLRLVMSNKERSLSAIGGGACCGVRVACLTGGDGDGVVAIQLRLRRGGDSCVAFQAGGLLRGIGRVFGGGAGDGGGALGGGDLGG